jgi:hypothetical protein
VRGGQSANPIAFSNTERFLEKDDMMISDTITRRTFLATSSAMAASLVIAGGSAFAKSAAHPMASGVRSGRVGPRGIPAGTALASSVGEIVLEDGSVVEASLTTSPGLHAGRSVLLAPDEQGGWSILYAEFADSQ